MTKKEAPKNVIDLIQTDVKAKKFRNNYPVSEELKQIMVSEVFRDFMAYCLEEYYHEENLLLLKEFIDDHKPCLEKRNGLLHNLFWWKLIYESSGNASWSYMKDYISKSYSSLRNKPFLTSWLRECEKVVPSFYYVLHKDHDHAFIVIDILTNQLLQIKVYDPTAIPPKSGEIVMGTLIPMGGGFFFPIVDFYHFDYEAREAIAACIHYHFDKQLQTSSCLHSVFIHVFSAMLQIERMVLMKNQEKKSLETSPK